MNPDCSLLGTEDATCVEEHPGTDQEACLMQDATGLGTGPVSLSAMVRPGFLDCADGECGDLTVNCMGPHLCAVLCGAGSCDGLTLNCASIGPCLLECTDTAAGTCDNLALNCGDNRCELAIAPMSSPMPMPDVECGGACECVLPMPPT